MTAALHPLGELKWDPGAVYRHYVFHCKIERARASPGSSAFTLDHPGRGNCTSIYDQHAIDENAPGYQKVNSTSVLNLCGGDCLSRLQSDHGAGGNLHANRCRRSDRFRRPSDSHGRRAIRHHFHCHQNGVRNTTHLQVSQDWWKYIEDAA